MLTARSLLLSALDGCNDIRTLGNDEQEGLRLEKSSAWKVTLKRMAPTSSNTLRGCMRWKSVILEVMDDLHEETNMACGNRTLFHSPKSRDTFVIGSERNLLLQ